ncbi:hypothetical protein D3C76_1731310 [compost metagenome]
MGFIQGSQPIATQQPPLISHIIQVHRQCAALNQCSEKHRLVVIAIHQHQVAGCQKGTCNYLVGGGRAIEHKPGIVGTENSCGQLLGLLYRAFMT